LEPEVFEISATDGKALHTRRWLPENEPGIVVLIVHGMGEHGGRYGPFAAELAAAGFAVYAPDLRGHGLTDQSEERIVHFADQRGWHQVLDDIGCAVRHLRSSHPEASLFLVGHSMGSLLTRSYIQRPARGAERIDGAILSATQGDPGLLAQAGRLLAALETARLGPRGASRLLRKLLFGNFNRVFRPNRTPFDWLNRDRSEVDRYIADPLIAKAYTAAFFRDLIGGVIELNRPSNMARTPRDMPLLFVSGERDPLGGFARGVRKTAERYRALGLTDVTVRIYEGARHEIFHEYCKGQVYSDIIGWLKERAEKGRRAAPHEDE